MLASSAPPLLLLAGAAALMLAAWAARPPRPALGSVTSVALLAFAAVVLGSTWLWGSHYTPVAVYQMALVLAAYGVGRSLAQTGRGEVAVGALAAVALVAAVWGLWQVEGLGWARAQASFETPNLLAAFLNLALVPIAVLTQLRGPRTLGWVALTLLWAGLLATRSRGGLLGLGAAAVMMTLVLVGSGWRPSRRALAALAAAAVAGYALLQLHPSLPIPVAEPANTAARAHARAAFAEARLDSAESRLELYALAAKHARRHLFAGEGYLSFGRLLARDQARVPSYAPGMTTPFVHDDYLQVLLELGLVGLLPFLALVLAPPLAAYRRKRDLDPRSPRDALGLAAIVGLAGMAAHALVDFPFYVPGTITGYGLLLGLADDWLHPAGAALSHARSLSRPAWLGRAALIACGAYALAMPAAAASCSLVARERVARGDIADAVYWLQVARNFDPRDWRRSWQLGALLAQQAALLDDPRLAQLAADAYVAGMRADPGDVHNLLGWLTLERRFGARLAHPASPVELRARLHEALALAPLDTAVRIEQVLMLRHLGEARRAQTAAAALRRDFPDDPNVRRLLAARARR